MSEHDADAVVERISAKLLRDDGWAKYGTSEEWISLVFRHGVSATLTALKPGDRLPGGNEVISSATLDDWQQKMHKIEALVEALPGAYRAAASGDT